MRRVPWANPLSLYALRVEAVVEHERARLAVRRLSQRIVCPDGFILSSRPLLK
jgi:hypothetical protein